MFPNSQSLLFAAANQMKPSEFTVGYSIIAYSSTICLIILYTLDFIDICAISLTIQSPYSITMLTTLQQVYNTL